ncbi:MAG: hypothetical protein PHX93_01090 [Candidatus Peribacteraceae bacterium]|jgi:hypothetical protein|nr:hypothetical protein [Candidatus Peribacteraceae bacterium]
MAKRRDRFPIGEHEEKMTFRTSVYPLGNTQNEQLLDEVLQVVDSDQSAVHCLMGEIRITRLTLDYATTVRKLLEGRRVLGGQCTLHEQYMTLGQSGISHLTKERGAVLL